MSLHGKISHWNDQKGYGFITPASGEDVFVHVRAFSDRDHQPALEQRVTFTLSKDKQGRPCAARVALLGEEPAGRFKRNDKAFYVAGAVVFLGIVGVSVGAGALPPVVLLIYVTASALSFVVYAWDKASARRGASRTPESTLHLLSLVGGWPGAMIAQQTLRHKSSKVEFRAVFWITVALNWALFVWLFTDSGSRLVNALLSGG